MCCCEFKERKNGPLLQFSIARILSQDPFFEVMRTLQSVLFSLEAEYDRILTFSLI